MTHHRVEKVPKVPVIGVCIKPRLLGPWPWAEFAAPLEGPPRPGRALLALETLQSGGRPRGSRQKKRPHKGGLFSLPEGGGGQGLAGVALLGDLGHRSRSCQAHLAVGGVEGDAVSRDSDTSTTGHEQPVGDGVAVGTVLTESETDDFRHPGLGAIPVDLEPIGVPKVQVVGGHEVERVTVLVRAESLNHDGRETGLRVNREDGDSVTIKGERVRGVDSGHVEFLG